MNILKKDKLFFYYYIIQSNINLMFKFNNFIYNLNNDDNEVKD